MKTTHKMLCITTLATLLAGCGQSGSQLRAMHDSPQGTYESLANYKARQPVVELDLPLEVEASPVLEQDWLRWAAYDSETETLHVNLPQKNFFISKKFLFVFNEAHFFRDYSRASLPALTGAVPLASNKDTAKIIAGMFWKVRYRPMVTRAQGISYERADRDSSFRQYDRYTYPVQFVAIELHDKNGKVWAAPLTANTTQPAPAPQSERN